MTQITKCTFHTWTCIEIISNTSINIFGNNYRWNSCLYKNSVVVSRGKFGTDERKANSTLY